MLYWQLIVSFFQIGLFSIGGGYAAMPIIQTQVVTLRHWLSMAEFADIVTISQMTPGPIAINAATFVGIRVSGLPGALAATLGCILPSCIIVLTLAYIYQKYQNLSIMQGILKGLRPAVVALIASSGVSMLLMALFHTEALPIDMKAFDTYSGLIFAVCFFLLRKWKKSPTAVMLGAGLAGIILFQVVPSFLS